MTDRHDVRCHHRRPPEEEAEAARETIGDRTRLAYHEAGHAVAAQAFLLRFRYVTIVPDDATGSRGHLRWDRPRQLPSTNAWNGLQGRGERQMREWAIVSLAGRAAENLVRRPPLSYSDSVRSDGPLTDKWFAKALVERLCTADAGDDEKEACVRWLWHTASRIVTDAPGRVMVGALASALLRRATLSFDEAQAVFSQCLESGSAG